MFRPWLTFFNISPPIGREVICLMVHLPLSFILDILNPTLNLHNNYISYSYKNIRGYLQRITHEREV